MAINSDTDVENFLSTFEQLHDERQKQTAERMKSLEDQVNIERELYKRSPKKKKVPPIVPMKSKSLSNIVEKDGDTKDTIFLLKPTARKDTNNSTSIKPFRSDRNGEEIRDFETFVQSIHIETPADMIKPGKGPHVIHYNDLIKKEARPDLPWNKHAQIERRRPDNDSKNKKVKINEVDLNIKDDIYAGEHNVNRETVSSMNKQSNSGENKKVETQRMRENATKAQNTLKSVPKQKRELEHMPNKRKQTLKPQSRPKPKPKPKPLVSLRHVIPNKKDNTQMGKREKVEIPMHKLRPVPEVPPKSKEIPQFLKQLESLRSPKPAAKPEKVVPEAFTQMKKLQKPKVGPKPNLTIPEAIAKRENLKKHTSVYKKNSADADVPEALKMIQQLKLRNDRFNAKKTDTSRVRIQETRGVENGVDGASHNKFRNAVKTEMMPVALPGMVKAQTMSSMPDALARMIKGKTITTNTTSRSKTIDNSDLNGSSKKLHHLTKGRARGPKRRLPRNLGGKNRGSNIDAAQKKTPPPIKRPSRNISLN